MNRDVLNTIAPGAAWSISPDETEAKCWGVDGVDWHVKWRWNGYACAVMATAHGRTYVRVDCANTAEAMMAVEQVKALFAARAGGLSDG